MRAFTTAAVIAVLAAGAFLPADDKGADKPQAAPDQAAIEKMMIEMARIGPHHDWFKKSVGEWNTKSTTYGMDGSEAAVTPGTAKFELLMDGRYLRQTFKSQYNGMPYEGIGLQGYDNTQQKYVGTWIDSMNTGIMHYEGTVDEKTGTETVIGTSITPLGPLTMKMVTEFPAKDRMTFTMSMLDGNGKESKQMVIDYTRK